MMYCKVRMPKNGFTLLEMLVAMTVAAILSGIFLNIFGTIHHGIVETVSHYELFVTENVKELRCRTSVVRGVSVRKKTCNDVFSDSLIKVHTYF